MLAVNSRCERIGHGGASALARANTLESFEAAADVGVDMVEFDVRAWGGELVLAHTIFDAHHRTNVRLRDALAHLSSRRFAGIGFNLDLKHGGCESRVLDSLSHAGLLQRTLVCSQVATVLDRVRAVDPRARTGISIGGRIARLSHRWGDWRAHVLDGLATRRWDALMAQHRLVDAHLLDEVRARDSLLYAWTVNERHTIRGLQELGVHGIATADPRLFA